MSLSSELASLTRRSLAYLSLRSPSFFFNDTATTEIYTLSLHDALPISLALSGLWHGAAWHFVIWGSLQRSEEHTSELQSHLNLVCRLLLEKKKHTMLPICDHGGGTWRLWAGLLPQRLQLMLLACGMRNR